jgi:4-amino-4-deoxy-L-arabinose transferase-like glycosyltransferase
MMVAVFEPATPRHYAPLARAAGVAAVVFVVLFWRLGSTSFWDPDEAHYAETTREMLATGDWWAPYYNEEPFFDKPIFFHQLQGIGMLALGENELGARIVPALATLALVLFTGWLGRRLISPEAGLVAALLLVVNPGSFGLSRYAILDTLFTALLFAGVGLIAVAALRDRPALQWPGYVLIACAVMVKGPLALVLSGLAMGISVLLSADVRRRLLGLHWFTGFALAVALSAPWFVYMYLRFGDAFVAGYVLDENIRLFASDRFPGQPGGLFYLELLATGMVPWTGLLLGRLHDDARNAVSGKSSRSLDNVEVILWAWTIAVVGFFSFSRFKLDHYIYTAAPSVCLLLGRTWTDLRANPVSPERNKGARIGLLLVGPLLVLLGGATTYFLVVQLALPVAAMLVPALVVAAGIMISARGLKRGRIPEVPWIGLTALTAIYCGIVLFVIPALDRQKVVPDVASWIVSRAGPETRICSFQLSRWNTAFRFYVNRHVTMLDDPDQLAAFVGTPGPFYCVMVQSGFEDFTKRGLPLKEVHAREGMFVTSGRVLWREPLPPTRFVVVTNVERGGVREIGRGDGPVNQLLSASRDIIGQPK